MSILQEAETDTSSAGSSGATSLEHVRLTEFYANARDIEIPRKPNLFLPDAWTRVFAKGLLKLDFKKSTVAEVGVGVGINAAGLLTSPNPPAHFIGTDLCADAIEASRALAEKHDLDKIALFQSDLFDKYPRRTLGSLDHIVACIPQIPDGNVDLTKGDNAAHIYTPTGSKWDNYGLGLNARLLKSASDYAPQASITLNLSGRPGIEILTGLFNEHGLSPQVIYKETVHQHLPTPLAPLAEMEKNGHDPFEFFADREGTHPLSATQAEDIRVSALAAGEDQANVGLFHKVYVIQGQRIGRQP